MKVISQFIKGKTVDPLTGISIFFSSFMMLNIDHFLNCKRKDESVIFMAYYYYY